MGVVRVPLISPMDVVIYRLDIQATWAYDPPGSTHDEGFDYLLGEPVVSRVSGVRTRARQEMAAVTVPCQVETARYEELRATFGGDNPATDQVFVLHRQDLESLSLLDASTKDCLLKPGDRIDHLEMNGRTVRTYQKPLYIYEVRMGSQGFGPDGYDLELVYTTYKSADYQGR